MNIYKDKQTQKNYIVEYISSKEFNGVYCDPYKWIGKQIKLKGNKDEIELFIENNFNLIGNV